MPSKTLSVIIPEETQKKLEQFAKSKLWSVSQSARVLIEQGLEKEFSQSLSEQPHLAEKESGESSTFKELVRQSYFKLMNAGKIGHQRLKELSYGQKATPKEKQQIAQTLGLDEAELPDD